MLILVHYGELALKGKNRSLFEQKLMDNIKKSVGGRIYRLQGRLVVESDDIESLRNVFGISWFAPAFRVEKKIESIKELVLSKVGERAKNVATFGVIVKRADKSFPYSSVQFADIIGKEIVDKFNLKVDLKKPELSVYIEIADEVFVYFEKISGLGGFPVGVSGKVLCLFSGGIDSPVAAYLMMKRGCEVNFMHFHSLNASKAVLKTKIKDLVDNLGKYQLSSKLILVPYHPFHLALLNSGINNSYELVLFRRFMAKVSEQIAFSYGYKALVTGDSLGQVASQTIENLGVLTESISLPIFQPLISFDKQEIVDLAKKINSYELSIMPYKDCCSIIAKRPTTRVKSNLIKSFEQSINLEKVMDDTLKLKEVYDL